jgi:hypothetical protein
MLLQYLKHEVYVSYKSSVRTSQESLCLYVVDKVNALNRNKHCVCSESQRNRNMLCNIFGLLKKCETN